MDSEFVVRRAEFSDADELAELHLRCRREAYASLLSAEFFEKESMAESIAQWFRILTGPHADRHWVAVHEGRLVGFAGSTPPVPGTSSPAELWGIYLLSAYQGSGLGQQLLEATIGTESATLWVARDNPQAHAFYRRNGFAASGLEKILDDWEGMMVIQMVRFNEPSSGQRLPRLISEILRRR